MSRRGPDYSLQKLLDLRRRQERDRALELSRLRQALAGEERRLRALEARRASPGRAASTAGQLQARERYAEGLRQRIADQRAIRKKAADAVDRAAKAMHDASRRREVVEEDRARWARQRRREGVARDQRQAEETGHAGFRKRRI